MALKVQQLTNKTLTGHSVDVYWEDLSSLLGLESMRNVLLLNRNAIHRLIYTQILYIYVCVCTRICTSVIIHLVVYIVKTNYVVNFFTDWLRVIENISPESHSKYLVQFIKGKCCRNRASPPKLLTGCSLGLRAELQKRFKGRMVFSKVYL